MSLVTVKTKFQVTIPQELRQQLALAEGDLLEAAVEHGRLVFTPKVVVDRDAAFSDVRRIADEARTRWEAEGKTEEKERLADETMPEVKATRKTKRRR